MRGDRRRLHWAVMTLAMGIVIPGVVYGGSELGLDGVGLEARFVEPGSGEGTIGLGALFDLGGFTPNVRLEGRVDFWSYSEDMSVGEASARDIAVGARGKYVFPVSHPRVRPFAGAGLGIHFLHAEVDIPEQNIGGFIVPGSHVEESSTKLGLDFGGGMNYLFDGPASLVSELWFTMVDGNADLSLGVGVMWALGGSGETSSQ